MKQTFGALVFVLTASLVGTADADDLSDVQSLVNAHCVRCHGPNEPMGDLRLDELKSLAPSAFQSMYERVASGQMPPPDERRQPTDTQKSQLMRELLALAQRAKRDASTTFRRLNKREYGNTVRDLLGLRKGTFDPGAFVYGDEIDKGFDTRAESLVISNELLIEYMDAAEKSLRHALFTSSIEKPRSRVINVNLKRVAGTSRRYINHHKNYVIGRAGGKGKLYDGQASRVMKVPGRYVITVTAAAVDRDHYPVQFQPAQGPVVLGFGVAAADNQNVSLRVGRLFETVKLKDNVNQTFEFETWIDRGHYPYLSFVNGSGKPISQIRSNIRRRKIPASAMKQPYRGPGIKVSQFKVEGPFHDEWPPQSIRTTYDSDRIPDLSMQTEREQAVHRFAARAFRRIVTPADMKPYLSYLNEQHAKSGDWHQATIRTFAAMMSSLDFLYLHEEPGQLNSYALANRLSYFFWSTMPDKELSRLARTDKLRDPTVLKQQVARMMNDSRIERFCNSFADQWLALNKLGTMPPDIKDRRYKMYYRDGLETAMRTETRTYFRHVLLENRSVEEFLDSDYSFINAGLAKLYDVPFSGSKNEFTRVRFASGSGRGGLLGHGSILALTSNGVETSPVERGVWVLSHLLGTPPPEPPKEVPALTPDLNGTKTVRDLLQAHRNDKACMECHRRIDPLGFALEAYDPIGRKRATYSKTQRVSTHGNYLGQDFANVDELRRLLTKDTHQFARSLIVRIAEYAKGRTLTASDYPTVEKLLKRTSQNRFRFRDMVVDLVTSDLMTNQ